MGLRWSVRVCAGPCGSVRVRAASLQSFSLAVDMFSICLCFILIVDNPYDRLNHFSSLVSCVNFTFKDTVTKFTLVILHFDNIADFGLNKCYLEYCSFLKFWPIFAFFLLI